MTVLLNGRVVSQRVRSEVESEIRDLPEFMPKPRLIVVLVGEDPASQVYVRNKARRAEEVGIRAETLRMPASVSAEQVLQVVVKANKDPDVDGILVQLPLPKHISSEQTRSILNAIDPDKDVDGLHPLNLGRLLDGQPGLVPCTPTGCMRLIEESGISIAGKRAVVVGRSSIVGKPVGQLLLNQSATVTYCHSRTQALADECRQADILIAAVGRPNLIRGSWLKSGAVVIDVGINRLDSGALCGDVDFNEAQDVAGFLTPVPGGVGPMTIAYLLANVVKAAKMRRLHD